MIWRCAGINISLHRAEVQPYHADVQIPYILYQSYTIANHSRNLLTLVTSANSTILHLLLLLQTTSLSLSQGMPLLRRKPFVANVPKKTLKADDDVFYCEMTGEAFLDYETFYQRMILCNSLVWSCELTGRSNLTYKEALESEETTKKLMDVLPHPLKHALLTIVHHTKQSKIQTLTDLGFDFLRNRYQVSEQVEVKVKDVWYDGIIKIIPDTSNVSKLNKKLMLPLESKSEEIDQENNQVKSKHRSLLGSKSNWPDASTIQYEVEIMKGTKKGSIVSVIGKMIRRGKGIFVKDRIKLFIKQACARTTISSDDGYWVVLEKEVDKYGLGESSIVPPEIVRKSPKKKRKSLSKEEGKKKKKKKIDSKQKTLDEMIKGGCHGKKSTKSSGDRPKELTLEQKKKEYIKEKERKKLDLDNLKMTKLKEKEEEKARKKNEREKEREKQIEAKKLELDFLKEFNKPREDLKLEDSKPLPTFVPFKSVLDQELIGDCVMVVEFVNIFGSLFDLDNEIDGKVSFSWLEEALTEHDAEGKYYEILRFLLHAYLRLQQDENTHMNDDDDDASTSGENTPAMQPENGIDNEQALAKKASANARAAAVWPMLYQGMALRDLTIEPYSLTEILRLHILSSGVQIGGIVNYVDWQRRGQYQMSDDPCVSFRHREYMIMTKLMTNSVYDLGIDEKLKVLVLLCNQALMLSTTREYMEDAVDKIKSLRKELRELQHEENRRRRMVAQERWKKKLEERNKQKEEAERKKKEKLSQNSPNTGTKPKSSPVPAKESAGAEKKVETEEITEGGDKSGKSQEELQEERKRRREAKEIQIEEFHHDKFLFKEKELLNEIAKYSLIISEVPFGKDRTFRRYWKFSSIDGVYVENNDDGAIQLLKLDESAGEVEEVETEDEDERTPMDDVEIKRKECTSVSLEDILQAKENGESLHKLILNRYKCEYTPQCEDIINKSAVLKPFIENIKCGIDTGVYSVRDRTKWYSISNKEQFESLLKSVNPRGLREQALRTTLSNEQKQIMEHFDDIEKRKEKALNRKARPTQKKPDPNEIDKTLFKTMDDYIEGNLRDQLLELEERLYLANFGSISVDKRDQWRAAIEDGINKLINTEPVGVASKKNSMNGVENNLLNGDAINVDNAGKDNKPKVQLPNDNGITNGVHDSMEVDDQDTSAPAKALPLHIKSNVKEEQTRCSTPVEVPENEKQVIVQELAEALLQIEKSLEKKFLKPPLGESDEIKRERIKEMLEAANAEFEISKNAHDEAKKDDEEKKSSTCLSRWEESLLKCTSFSQVFVHLNTLDRSVIWDKSIQNTRCRMCRRKGNEEEMLLCDGCDRGFHMGCLKPPLKAVPKGDWFCHDCRPIHIQRRSRKHSTKSQEDTEEEEEEESEDETEEEVEEVEEDSEEESENDEDSEEDSEDESEEESEAESEASTHGEYCTVCNKDGTLILCEDCPRSFHIECCYPPLKKVPRGVWHCQICTGADADLPYRKRAQTHEKLREKAQKEAEKEMQQKKKKTQQRGKPTSSDKQSKRNQTTPPSERPSKRVKLDSDTESQGSSHSSQRSSVGFGRQQLKHCTTLINDIFKRSEADVFLDPVDLTEVPDYTDFIDHPMDFGTIKRKLNTAKYHEVTNFLDDIGLVFSNCESYNPPRSQVARDGSKLKTFVNKRIKDLCLK
ncbi:bromodomain adjacent to zinc finger domain protein 1A-like isoform X2 [Hydractinia symbiolongicarpus]|uniref:bromodomain adjacent to zinc finger domain protein 1A-like isoform X2 n=1 Tax=Hydractinia symbiolongicarpus TaxID=13093 RepID=UPI00254B5B7C|nr:bromodomain adjacent to zinc finger domain protein 1A-like isoform X2 [Hydractinia symbiolongicarpus]